MSSFADRVLATGIAHFAAGRLAEAENVLRGLLQDEGTDPRVYEFLGLIAERTKRLPDARKWLQKAVDTAPSQAAWYSNLGRVQIALSENATATFQKVIDLLATAPAAPETHYTRGLALQQLDRHAESEDAFTRALNAAPDSGLYAACLASAFRHQGKFGEAKNAFEKALLLNYDSPPMRAAYSMTLLALGDFANGFREFNAREAVQRLRASRSPIPLWEGQPAPTILLRGEQGFGDVIQFLRFAPLVAKRNIHITLECHPELLALARSVQGVSATVPPGGPYPQVTCQQLLLSLPRVFGIDSENKIPREVPYLAPPAQNAATWQARFVSNHLKIGLCWAGRPTHANDANRSLPGNLFSHLANIPNVKFFSLQKGDATKQFPTINLPITDLSADLKDFSDTAAAISALDLIITVDTAIAHLAGALAKPCYLLLPEPADWRWLTRRDDSPWYPTLKLFRQPTPGNWLAPLTLVRSALLARVGEFRSQD